MVINKISLLSLFGLLSINASFAQTKPAVAKPKTQISNTQTTKSQMLKHPDWCLNNTIYEVNLRQYSNNSSFKNFINELPRLRKLGVDILWFMPIHPIGLVERKGTLGSYYAVQDYKAVSKEYGTMEDFRVMVDAIHKSGMKIIIDWVANHTSPDNIWVKQHPDFYTKDKNGKFVPPVDDWSDVIDLNYDNKELRSAMIDAMKFWLTRTNIDGFRCDVAEMVPTDFWIECRTELDKVKPVFMLAEGEKPELHKAFDMTYTWSFYHTLKDVIEGTKKRSDLLNYFADQKKNFTKNDLRMYFTSNHDENTWNKTEFEAFGEGHKMAAALTATLPGMPLIYSGQESGQRKHLKFFDKDVIEWGSFENSEFYSALNKFHKTQPAINPFAKMEIIDVKNDNVFVFKRGTDKDEVLVIANLKSSLENINIAETIAGTYNNLFDINKLKIDAKSELSLEGFQFLILQKSK